jgi:hypothetical protein
MLTLMEIFKNFLYFKSNTNLIHENKPGINKLISSLIAGKKKLKYKNQIKINPLFLKMSIEELISNFSILDFNAYLILGNIFIDKEKKNIDVNIQYKNKYYKFNMCHREQKDLLCFKTKRKDELIKFSFKFIRRQIFKEFQETHKRRFEESAKNNFKMLFYKTYMENDPDAINFFENFDLYRVNLNFISKFTKLQKLITDFQKSKFIRELIHEYILDKSEHIMRDNLCFYDFVKEILSRQHKHSILIQGVLNSLDHFIQYFQFNY